MEVPREELRRTLEFCVFLEFATNLRERARFSICKEETKHCGVCWVRLYSSQKNVRSRLNLISFDNGHGGSDNCPKIGVECHGAKLQNIFRIDVPGFL